MAIGTSLTELAETWWIRLDRSPLRLMRWALAWLLIWAVMLLLTPLAIIGRLVGLRFLGFNHRRIGHLAVEPDCFVKEQALGLHRGIIPIACAPITQVGNPALLECWKPRIRWITRPWLCAVLKPLEWHPLLAFDVSPYAMTPGPGGGCGYISIARQWKMGDPVVALPERILTAGKAALSQLGLPDGAWFVCVHNREGGYAPHEEDWHAYRNCSIDSYLPAMQEIVEAGGWCIRVGDPSLAPFPAMKNVVDYAHHPLRSDWLDLYLLARCRFFLGSSSGLFLVSCIFNRPVAIANMTPIEAILPFGERDLGIPKLLRRGDRPEVMTFLEMFDHPSSRYRFSAQFEKDNLTMIDNSAEEICELAAEMLRRLGGEADYTAEDEIMQERIKRRLHPQHIAYGSTSRVGRDFLRRYCRLLP